MMQFDLISQAVAESDKQVWENNKNSISSNCEDAKLMVINTFILIMNEEQRNKHLR